MRQHTRELLDALDRAGWFSAVGRPAAEPLRHEVIVVPSWDEAVECCGSISWENYTLEQQNLLTTHLHEHHRDRFRRWNDIVDEMKAAFEPLAERKLGPLVRHGLPEILGHRVRWDVLGACMEGEYADVRPQGFFTRLMDWYARGRFPCGWGYVDRDGQARLAEMEEDGGCLVSDPFTRAINFPLLEPPIRLPEGQLIIF